MFIVFIASITGIMTGIMYLINKRLSLEKYHPATFTVVYSFACGLLALPLLFFEFQLPPTPFSAAPLHWVLLFISPMIFGIGIFFQFKAYKTADASSVGLVGRLSLVVSAVLGVLLLREHLTSLAVVGLVMIALGGMIIFYEKGKLQVSQGLLFGLIMAVAIGIASVTDKVLLEKVSPFTYASINNFLVGVPFLASPVVRREMVPMIKHLKWRILGSAIIGASSWVAFLFILRSNAVSTVFPVLESMSLVTTVVLGMILLKERGQMWQKIVGAVITVAGVVMLG